MFRIILLSLSILSLCAPGALAAGSSWKEVKSTHFIVYYMNAKDDFVSKAADTAEYCYNRIADDLGFRRFDFWTWENRAKIYIYDNSADYQSGTGQPAWSSGAARMREKTIYTFLEAPKFFDVILPHEMGHIIFREFVGFDNAAVPLWLDEGVACYQEKARRLSAGRIIKQAISDGRFMNIENLFNFNPRLTQDAALINLFYAESLSVIDFLVKKFGSDSFISFCQGIRDKKDLNRALRHAYPFENTRDLDKAWQKYLNNA